MKVTAVIMAGGKGERFWPYSREKFPKQFLNLIGDEKSMIQHTIERILKIVDREDIFIITNEVYENIIQEQLPQISKDNIIFEPVAKNTAPCIGVAATYIQKKYDDALMVVLPSDHLIKYTDFFIDTLKIAIEVAAKGPYLTTIGMTPSYPETGYGYIKFKKNEDRYINNVYKVEKFVEKPNLEKAKEYLVSGKYLWNSGIFIWKASTILDRFKELLPEMYRGFEKIRLTIGTDMEKQVLQEEYCKFESKSIDYAIMEKSSGIYTIPGNFGWDDVGNWLALERVYKSDNDGNIINGDVIALHSRNSIIQSKSKLVATIGTEDLIIIDTEDVLLICGKNYTQNIKEIISEIKRTERQEYL